MALSNNAKQYIRKHKSSKSIKELAKSVNLSEDEVRDFIKSDTQKPESSAKSELSPKRKILFTVIALSIPIVFFAVFELTLRVTDYRGDNSLFIQLSQDDGKYSITNPNFATRYFFYTTVVPNPPLELFLTEKPENGFRVFVMGESSAAGYPYGFNGVPGRVIRDALQDAMPQSHVEVITVATSAINSYTLYDQVDEILDQKPDAILIYTGHNEFYGALGAGSNESLGNFPGFVRFYLKIQRFKTFLFVRDQITGFTKWMASRNQPQSNGGLNTLMQQVVRDQAITLDSPVYELGKRQFESNMNQILNAFDRADIPVFIGSLASNLRDHAPFESIETENHPAADEVFDQAQQHWNDGDFDSAKILYQQARDLDALKFRATGEFNTIIKRLAERENVYYVPVKEHLSDIAENGIIGFDLMLEHLHPNDRGYFELAWRFFESIDETNFVGHEADRSKIHPKEHYYEGMHLTELDHFVIKHRLHVLTRSWPFEREGRRDVYRDYVFEGRIDSLAFEIVSNQKRWDVAKVELGDYYLRRGELDNMLAEYRGLMRDQPYNESPFLIAAQQLLDRNRLEEAYPYLRHAHNIDPSAFTFKMIGAIYVNQGEFARGINYLESSLERSPRDGQAMFNLSGAYGQMGEIEKALEIVNELVSFQPSFPGAMSWKAQLEAIQNRRQ
ncbi:MAG: GDSL-type esterase/lipase family protein [Balneolales bacterium]|nr:GDSL-type esterase/lipase family protein [Balneolales bacterium]